MYYVQFRRLPDGAYTLVEHNDERLYMFAQLLLNDDLRGTIKTEWIDFPGIKKGEVVSFDIPQHAKITFQLVQDNRLIIKLYHPDPTHKLLQTDIPNDALVNLIEDWEDLAYAEAPEIYLLRDHDKDTVIVSQTRL